MCTKLYSEIYDSSSYIRQQFFNVDDSPRPKSITLCFAQTHEWLLHKSAVIDSHCFASCEMLWVRTPWINLLEYEFQIKNEPASHLDHERKFNGTPYLWVFFFSPKRLKMLSTSYFALSVPWHILVKRFRGYLVLFSGFFLWLTTNSTYILHGQNFIFPLPNSLLLLRCTTQYQCTFKKFLRRNRLKKMSN